MSDIKEFFRFRVRFCLVWTLLNTCDVILDTKQKYDPHNFFGFCLDPQMNLNEILFNAAAQCGSTG